MKRLAVIVTILSVVAFGALAYGQMAGHGMGEGMMGGPGTGCEMMGGHGMGHERGGFGHPMWGLLKRLDLDEQQKASIREIRDMTMKDTIRKKADLEIVRIELKELLFRDPVDMKAVEAKLKQEETLRTEMRLSHIKAMQEVKAKLTPDQRKKFREMIEEGPMMGPMGMMREHRHGRGMMGE